MDQEMALRALVKTIGFKQMPPDITTFITDPYYLGNYFKIIYPFWQQKLKEIFPDPLTLKSSIVVFTGAIGGGKTTMSQIMIAYQMCKIACMENPEQYFKINAQQGYFVKMLNIYKWKAEDFCRTVNDMIFGKKIPFFQRELESGNKFLNNLHISTAAKPKDMVSNDLVIGHLSEINFMKPDVAKDLIDQTFSRIDSRFIRGTNLFDMLIIDSSTTGPDSPVETFIKNDPKASEAVIVRVNQWEVKKGLGIFGNYGWFKVFIGDGSHDPFIIPDDYPEVKLQKLDKDLIIEAPMELYDQAKRNIVLFLQEQAGISTATTSTFFKDKNILDKAFVLQQEVDDVIVLDFFDPYDTLFEKLKKDLRNIPSDRKLYIRIDCGVSSDNFGFSIAYADGIVRNVIDEVNVDRMKIFFPIAIAISRKDGEETPIPKIIDFIIQLNQTFTVDLVTTDSYQSTVIRQELIQAGIKAEMYSCDRHDEAYRKLKEYIYSGLIALPDSQLLRKEMSQLQRVGPDKIDHIPKEIGGSKDVSDTVAGTVFKMVELGPEEVLSPPEEKIQSEMVDVYSQLTENMRNRISKLSAISNAESYFRM